MNGECFTVLSRAEQTVGDGLVLHEAASTVVMQLQWWKMAMGEPMGLGGEANPSLALLCPPYLLLSWAFLVGLASALCSISDGCALLGSSTDNIGCFRSVTVGVALHRSCFQFLLEKANNMHVF